MPIAERFSIPLMACRTESKSEFYATASVTIGAAALSSALTLECHDE